MNSTKDLKQLRDAVAQVSLDVIGKSPDVASVICANFGLRSRYVSRDGQGFMITADCRMDRIGFVINDDIVTAVRNG